MPKGKNILEYGLGLSKHMVIIKKKIFHLYSLWHPSSSTSSKRDLTQLHGSVSSNGHLFFKITSKF